MQGLMKQAQMMQKKMEEAQEKLAQTEVSIIFIHSHLYFHGSRILCDLPMSKMIKKQDNSNPHTKRIREF